MSDDDDEDAGPERLSLAEKFRRHGVEYKPPTNGDLTDRWLQRCTPTMPFGYVVYDGKSTGLGISVAPSGRKNWCLQTTFPGQRSQARRKLGTYPTLSLKDARAKAVEWLTQIENGVDPADAAEEKREAELAARTAKALSNKQTFASVAEAYIETRSNRRAATDAKEIRRMLIPELGPRPISSIEPRDVRELFARLIKHAAYDAKNAWVHADQIFKFAVEEELLSVSPCASVSKKKLFAGKIKARQRTLTDEELRAFWVGTEKLDAPYGALFRLLLLTGARVNELAASRWSEIDPALRRALRDARGAPINWSALPDEIKVLRVPESRFKSDRPHTVELSADALTIIEQLRRSGTGDFISARRASSRSASCRERRPPSTRPCSATCATKLGAVMRTLSRSNCHIGSRTI